MLAPPVGGFFQPSPKASDRTEPRHSSRSCRALLSLHIAADQMTVKSLAEVATAFATAPAKVKNHLRESGMPCKSGRWDLAAILSWRMARDTRAAGGFIDTTPVERLVDRDLERLSERHGIMHVIAGGERLAQAWTDTLAECERTK